MGDFDWLKPWSEELQVYVSQMDKQPQMRFWMWLGQNETLMKLLGQEHWTEIITYLDEEKTYSYLKLRLKNMWNLHPKNMKEIKKMRKPPVITCSKKNPFIWEILVLLINDDMKSEKVLSGKEATDGKTESTMIKWEFPGAKPWQNKSNWTINYSLYTNNGI